MRESLLSSLTTDPSNTTVQVEFLREAHGIADGLKRDLERFRSFDHRYGELVHILDVFQGIAEEKMADSLPQ